MATTNIKATFCNSNTGAHAGFDPFIILIDN
jgi:hypothetical protein